MSRSPRTRIAVTLAAVLLLGCGDDERLDAAEAGRPVALTDQEDAVCGMLVRDQSAPRGQLVHRDGTRSFFCSIADLLIYLDTPSPHGRTHAVFVEVMEPDEDPRATHLGEHPWQRFEETVFVVGVARMGIMGPPVLAYADRADADPIAARHPGARILDAEELRTWWRTRSQGH